MMDWSYVIELSQVPEEILRKYCMKNWILVHSVTMKQKLSEEFLRDYQAVLDWVIIPARQTLSEAFIEDFSSVISSRGVSLYQNISFDFIMKYLEKMDLELVSGNVNIKLTKEEKKKLQELKSLQDSF